MSHRAFQYRLYPTAEQAETLAQFVGATRFVYNLALEQRRIFGRRGRSFSFVNQGREVTALRRDVDWLRAVPVAAATQALRDLDKAFAAFFAGRAGYPGARKRGVNDSFSCKFKEVGYRRINRRWSSVRVPNLGWIRVRHTRDLQGAPKNVTFSRNGLGWFVTFAAKIEHEAEPSVLPSLGIDRGLANTLALSNGEMVSTTDTAALERRKRRAQRVMARRQRGSARYRKQRGRLSRITAKIARVRADWRHKASLSIALRFGTVAIEALKIPNMTAAGRGKRGLNRSILEQGWGAFERVLAYKLEERGGSLVKVNPAYTSQECSSCGVTDKASRESQASYACRHCGSAIHADTNAALNILRRGTAFMRAEDAGHSADETRTINLAA